MRSAATTAWLLAGLAQIIPAANARPAADAPIADADGLASAIATDDVSGAAAALAAGAKTNARLEYGESPLARAVETQDAQLVRTLLEHKAKPDTPDASGFTPLSLACERGSRQIIGLLLDARADVRLAASDGMPPLAICARFAPGETVSRMLAMGAPADSIDARGQTPLMWAASAGNETAMSALIGAGAKVNAVTPGRFTPLFFAIKSGNPVAAQMLLDAGADASWRGPENTSAAQLAVYQHNWTVAMMLVDHGADLVERDRHGLQLLHAASQGGDAALVARLLGAGADPNGLTGPSRIEWVTEANFGVPPPPVPPMPPLLIAARHGHRDVMKLLIASGANPDFVAENGTNVLLAAAAGTDPQTLAYALTLAPNVNVQRTGGATPLHLVLAGGDHPHLEAMLRILADGGARTDIANDNGTTATDMAASGLSTVRTAYDHVFAGRPSAVLAVPTE